MEPMEAIEPMKGIERWWPQELGDPSSSGSQNDTRYAFFAEKRRLLVEANGKRSTCDSDDRQITGVSQSGRGRGKRQCSRVRRARCLWTSSVFLRYDPRQTAQVIYLAVDTSTSST